jgi:RNA-directed DNA polymerase
MPNLTTTTTQSVGGRLPDLAHLHTVAKQVRSLRFNNLLHHITPMLLERAYNRLNRKSAKGIDNESWTSFGERLPERIQNLHQRIHTQQYKPQPVLRIWLPKQMGKNAA